MIFKQIIFAVLWWVMSLTALDTASVYTGGTGIEITGLNRSAEFADRVYVLEFVGDPGLTVCYDFSSLVCHEYGE